MIGHEKEVKPHHRPAEMLPLRTPKTRLIQTLATYKAGTASQELMAQIKAYEKREKLPALRPGKHRNTACVIRYNLLHDEKELAVKTMAHNITHAEIWIALAGLTGAKS